MCLVARLSITLAALCFAACGPMTDPRNAEVDLRPPQVQSVASTGSGQISLDFDEDAGLVAEKTRITPPLSIGGISGSGSQIVIQTETQTCGCHYALEAEARDARGNTASFVAEFYGFNGKVPKLLINEFTPRGSANHPDLVELAVRTPGDMGGVTLLVGTPGSFDARLVFPSFAVAPGDFILVHCKPSGDPAEVNETLDRAASRGLDASDAAFDFWLPGGAGMGGNNGVLSLYDRPGGACMDGVLYSNRTSQSDEKYRGFGSEEMLARAEELVRDSGWKCAGARVVPEDAVSPEGSTATRSLCRSSTSLDTDGPEDWHVVPTKKATFGGINSDEAWEGK